ncbi:MAG: sodium-translocating pyrophosphatase [Dehalococcoidales bacterium]|nr:sodium-translocating pyrophosphatase [Dehalococcoidales bacterium]
MPAIFWVVPAAGVVTIIFAIALARNVLSKPTGTPKMKEIGDIIFQAAWAFLKRQYTTIAIYSLVIGIVIGVLVAILGGTEVQGLSKIDIGLRTSIAFLVGAICSGVAGFIGMYIAVKSNVRCAAAAQKSLTEAVNVALRGGAVSGFLITALSLIGVTVIFFAYGGNTTPEIAPHLIVGFGFGASFVALFAQLGGGIYTKAADVAADLVGKIEAGIPEDDPRNPAVIADLVGDNVGDCAGRGADLFESTAAENIGAMILGIAAYLVTDNVAWILFPLVVRGFGMFSSMIGLLFVKAKEDGDAMAALNRGYFVAIGLSVIGLGVSVKYMLDDWWLFGAGIVGIVASVIIIFVTQYYTESKYSPVKEIAEASKTGPATNIIMGISIGFSTTFATAIIIGGALLVSYWMGMQAGEHLNLSLVYNINWGALGTAVATMGMLMTCPYVLSMDTFGPITDNANGINEMAGAGQEVRKITDRLDAVGNTTKALTKGYAMVSAGLAAFLLFEAYIERVNFLRPDNPLHSVDLSRIEVFVGALLAGMIVFLFSGWAIKAVGKTASKIIEEVRRQFREDPEILNPKDPNNPHMPDYGKAVDITTRAGLREMIKPGLLPVLGPIVIGIFFRFLPGDYDAAMVVAAVLMVGTIVGILMASFMNNGGGAWDNAKKMIEDGQLKDENGVAIGKGSDTHAAAVVGDTVGDPLKDTAGPSLHVLVKLLATITLVMAPLFIG